MAELIVLGESPLADAVRTVKIDSSVPLVWVCDATTDEIKVAEFVRHADAKNVIISSPVPVGTTAALEECWPSRRFAYVPENVRRASAVDDFIWQDRIVIGTRDEEFYGFIEDLLVTFSDTF